MRTANELFKVLSKDFFSKSGTPDRELHEITLEQGKSMLYNLFKGKHAFSFAEYSLLFDFIVNNCKRESNSDCGLSEETLKSGVICDGGRKVLIVAGEHSESKGLIVKEIWEDPTQERMLHFDDLVSDAETPKHTGNTNKPFYFSVNRKGRNHKY